MRKREKVDDKGKEAGEIISFAIDTRKWTANG